MRAYADISAYWPADENGRPVTVNSVYVRFIATDNKLSYDTLAGARFGTLTGGKFTNLVKLANICSALSGQKVSVQDLIKEEQP
jgi:hypothetical protein